MPVPPEQALDAKAESRPSFLTVGRRVVRRIESDADPMRLPAPAARGRVTVLYPPCGPSVRPYLWPDPTPYLGTVWRLGYDFTGLPIEGDGDVDVGLAWVVVSLARPLNEAEPAHVFPDGCALRWDLAGPGTLVWAFRGAEPYHDLAFDRPAGSRVAVLTLPIPADPALSGARLWTQAIRYDGRTWRFSQLLEIVFGVSASAIARSSESR